MLPSLQNLAISPLEKVGCRNENPVVVTIVGLINGDAGTLLTLRGLLYYLQLCRSGTQQLGCTDKVKWRNLLNEAEKNTNRSPEDNEPNKQLLKTTAEVDQYVAANAISVSESAPYKRESESAPYKREFIKYVIFRSLFGYPTYANKSSKAKENGIFGFFFMHSQVDTFINRKNGCIGNVIKAIKDEMTSVRRYDPEYPPVPADFFAATVNMIADNNEKLSKADNNEKRCKAIRIENLRKAIRETDFY